MQDERRWAARLESGRWDLDPRPPEPHSGQEPGQIRQNLALTPCSGNRCRIEETFGGPEVVRNSQQNSQHERSSDHALCCSRMIRGNPHPTQTPSRTRSTANTTGCRGSGAVAGGGHGHERRLRAGPAGAVSAGLNCLGRFHVVAKYGRYSRRLTALACSYPMGFFFFRLFLRIERG